MAPGDRVVDKLLGELGPTSGRSVGGVEHTCVKTLKRNGCPGCLDDALAATMGAKRNPRPGMKIIEYPIARKATVAAEAIVKEELHEQAARTGYREQTCHACEQTLRSSPPLSSRARAMSAYAWFFAACVLSFGSARVALAVQLATFAAFFFIGRWLLGRSARSTRR